MPISWGMGNFQYPLLLLNGLKRSEMQAKIPFLRVLAFS